MLYLKTIILRKMLIRFKFYSVQNETILHCPRDIKENMIFYKKNT